ncbi:MAG: dienelactone hydrolase family protein [Planctomycetaceae bacterium]
MSKREQHRETVRNSLSLFVGGCWAFFLLGYWQVATAELPALPPQFVEQAFDDASGTHRYVVFKPQITTSEPLPVVLFLHGAGEKGSDGRRQLFVGMGTALEQYPDFPAYVVFPQCEDLNGRHLLGWRADRADAQRAIRILDEAIAEYNIDEERQVLCGWSMGGYGAWSVAAASPERWLSVMAIAGGGNPESLNALAKAQTPVWAIHGEQDVLVPSEESKRMMTALTEHGGMGHLTLLKSVGHDSWRLPLGDPAALAWMLSPEGTPPELTGEPLPPQSSPKIVGEFRPDVVLSQALALRLGNGALAEIAQEIPVAVPPESLRGEMPDIRRTFEFQQETYFLNMENLKYQTKLHRCELGGISGGRFRIRFWLKPLTVSLGGASLRTEKAAIAEAEEFQIVIGHRRPFPVTLEVRPIVVDSRVRFRVLRQELHIPDDNWFVEPPRIIHSHSEDLPEAYVQTGLVGGLYQRRLELETEILSVVPTLLSGVEEHLHSLSQMGPQATIWPLPVLAPETRVLPGRIRTDNKGVSVELSLAAQFPGDLSENLNPERELLGQHYEDIAESDELSIALDWDIITALSRQFVRSGTARINVLDLPEPAFHELASQQVVDSLFPGRSASDLNVVLQLSSPMELHPVEQPLPGKARMLNLTATNVEICYFHTGTTGSDEELERFSFSLSQPLTWNWETGASGLTGTMSWGGDFHVGCSLNNPGAQLVARHFAAGWRKWTAAQPDTPITIPPLQIGRIQVEADTLDLTSERLKLEFRTANGPPQQEP